MPDERQTKNDKREAAREQARLTREKQKRQERLRRWLIPTGVTVVVLAIVAIVVLVVTTSAPPPQSADGPKNMVSDGILFTGSGGKMVPTKTGAVQASSSPTPNDLPNDGVAHIVTYVDFSCPACQAFEATNADTIQQLVEQGTATLEVHPIAILDSHFTTNYSTRANNVGACVANFAPESFYAVMKAMYVGQGQEQTAGLSNSQMVSLVHSAGLRNGDVDKCINGLTFKSWVTSATTRATTGPLPNTSTANVTGTPTVLVNGQQYGGSLTDGSAFTDFVQQVLAG
ncbi:MAG: thioredoxin domain-containing protein [Leifsonia sp.]|nr:thioredoxin domain-containing protein [Leifsonia sp.]